MEGLSENSGEIRAGLNLVILWLSSDWLRSYLLTITTITITATIITTIIYTITIYTIIIVTMIFASKEKTDFFRKTITFSKNTINSLTKKLSFLSRKHIQRSSKSKENISMNFFAKIKAMLSLERSCIFKCIHQSIVILQSRRWGESIKRSSRDNASTPRKK